MRRTFIASAIFAGVMVLISTGCSTHTPGNRASRNASARRTERVVNREIEWLVENQEPDGRWDCAKHGGNGGDVLSTALALLALNVYGNCVRVGKYKKQVAVAETWMWSRQQKDGLIGSGGIDSAIALWALLCEYDLVPQNESRVRVFLAASLARQTESGGWALPTNVVDARQRRVDECVLTAWYVLAMRIAQRVKLEVPNKALWRACEFLRRTKRLEFVENIPDSPEAETIRRNNALLASLALLALEYTSQKGEAENTKAKLIVESSARLPRDGNPDHLLWYFQRVALGTTRANLTEAWGKFNRRFHEVRSLDQRCHDPLFLRLCDPMGSIWGEIGHRAILTRSVSSLCYIYGPYDP